FVAPTSDKDFYSYSLSISQTIYDFEGNASRYGASRALLAASGYDTMRIRNLVALRFALAYFNLLESDKMVQVAMDEEARLETHLQDAQNLYEQGVITKNDLLQAEVRISDARRRLADARNARDIAASRVNSLLARPLDTEFQPVDVPGNEVFYPGAPGEGTAPDLRQAWMNAEKNRPELAVIAETLKSVGLEKKAAESEYYPKFFARGGYEYTKNSFETPNGNFSLIIGMGINLYGGGITRAEVARTGGEKSRLLEQRDNVKDDIRLEVKTYALDIEDALKRMDVTKDAVKQARENLRINRIRYEQGVGTATDVIDALTLLTVAETNRYSALYDFRKAEAGFLYSQGYDLAEVYR
ncbi:MAG: TolC family protein, partial [Nitrospiraceae bacterium]|nr:TolC family protein [Nitrospiraceae bacterium]